VNTWFIIGKDGQEHIAALAESQELAATGALTANGTFLDFPFVVLRPAGPGHVEYANAQLALHQQALLEIERDLCED